MGVSAACVKVDGKVESPECADMSAGNVRGVDSALGMCLPRSGRAISPPSLQARFGRLQETPAAA